MENLLGSEQLSIEKEFFWRVKWRAENGEAVGDEPKRFSLPMTGGHSMATNRIEMLATLINFLISE